MEALGRALEKETTESTALKSKPLSVPPEKAGEVTKHEKQYKKLTVSTVFKEHPTKKMLAMEWHAKEDVRVVERKAPTITDPADAIIKMTSMAICGSDLHMYYNSIPGTGSMQKGDILGHEGCGIVEEVGPEVKNIKIGDRVIISAAISCGQCEFCEKKQFSLCENTNPSEEMEKMYGYRISGIFGYSHLTGGYAGLFAEFARVPFADVNLLVIPKNSSITDDQAALLSDTANTGWHATRLANLQKGESVVVHGAGPIGLMASYYSYFQGAEPICTIDNIDYRLELAKQIGSNPVNFDKISEDTVEKHITSRYMPKGPDCDLDCVGFRYPKRTLLHSVARALRLETDSTDVVAEAIHMTKKGGKISLIGDYFGYCDGFPIGAFMEKGQSMAGGQVFVQAYWKQIMEWITEGLIDPSFLITHKLPFENIAEGFKIFAKKEQNCIKVILQTKFGREISKQWGESKPEAARKPPPFGKAWDVDKYGITKISR